MTDPRDYQRYLRERDRYPLWADDPAIVRPPLTAEQADERRQAYHRNIAQRLQGMEFDGLHRTITLYKLCRRQGVAGADVWRALAPVRDLSWWYWADALRRLLLSLDIGVEVVA